MPLYRYDGATPEVNDGAYVAPTATVIGRATLARDSSVWFHAVLRADNEPINIGVGSNVQEGAVLRTDPGFPLSVGRDVTVGHQAMLHGCSIGDGALIGIQAVVLNGAVIGKNCLVGAGALGTEGKVFPDNSLIVGSPAKVLRQLTQQEIAKFRAGAKDYVDRQKRYRVELQALPDEAVDASATSSAPTAAKQGS